MSDVERQEFLRSLDDDEAEALLYQWTFWARPKQLEPAGKWFCWLYLAGRGSGKTRAGAEWIRGRVESGRARRIALVGETFPDVRDTMILGDSGILSISPPHMRPVWSPANRSLTWPNGAQALVFAGENPDQLRGPQFDTAWVDELAKFYQPEETWDNLELGLRLGDQPQVMVTTTPRPIPIVKQLVKDPMVIVTTGSSYENISNLASSYIKRVIKKYEGTRLGRQELHAEVLTDVRGALWSYDTIEHMRMTKEEFANVELVRIAVSVDPAMSAEEDANETGIMVGGIDAKGHGYLFADVSDVYTPNEWGHTAIRMYDRFEADIICGETNQGGLLVENTLRTIRQNINFQSKWAVHNKGKRAEPISGLCQQGKIWLVGSFPVLEDQMVSMTPKEYLGAGSPDRLDAFVWLFWELMMGSYTSDDADDYEDYRK